MNENRQIAYWRYSLTLAGTGLLAILAGTGGRGTPPRVSPLIELELRNTNQRVGRDERKPKIPKFKDFGHLVTSQAVLVIWLFSSPKWDQNRQPIYQHWGHPNNILEHKWYLNCGITRNPKLPYHSSKHLKLKWPSSMSLSIFHLSLKWSIWKESI